MTDAPLRAELLRPSVLGTSERAAWQHMLTPGLQRAFLTPDFAEACERAHGRAMVAVLHRSGTIAGFMAFQFASAWHRRAGLAERIGGELCDAAALVGPEPVAPPELLRLCQLGCLHTANLVAGPADSFETGHVIAPSEAYAAGRRPEFVQDTARRLRRAAREFGALRLVVDTPDATAALRVIAAKRAQYWRTGVTDVFAVPHRLRLVAALCAAPAPECRPMLARLFAGERELAAHLGLLSGGVLSYWFPVYDPALERLSPGRLLLWTLVMQAGAHGITLIDRGAGDTPAKRDFSTGITQLGRANWVSGNWRAVPARLFQAAEWKARALPSTRQRAVPFGNP